MRKVYLQILQGAAHRQVCSFDFLWGVRSLRASVMWEALRGPLRPELVCGIPTTPP